MAMHPNETFSQAKKSYKERFYPVIDNIVENLFAHARSDVDASKSEFARLLDMTTKEAGSSLEGMLNSIVLDVIKFRCERTFVSTAQNINFESTVSSDDLPDLVGVKITSSSSPAKQIFVEETDKMDTQQALDSNKSAQMNNAEPSISKQEASFVCHLQDCNASFVERKELLAHYRTHSKFKCGLCGKLYKKVDPFEVHFARWHRDVHTFSCPHCIYTFATQYELHQHARAHSVVGPYKCTLCSLQFRKHYPASRHVLSCVDVYFPGQAQNDIEQFIEFLPIEKKDSN